MDDPVIFVCVYFLVMALPLLPILVALWCGWDLSTTVEIEISKSYPDDVGDIVGGFDYFKPDYNGSYKM